jgi:rhodanese-related sulfurtransferase
MLNLGETFKHISMKIFKLVGIGLVTSILWAASFSSNDLMLEEDIVLQTDDRLERVSKEEFKAFMSENDTYQLIDVRTPGEFSGGNIEGAKNIDFMNDSFEQEIQGLNKAIPTLIYCQSGGRSGKALKVFGKNGFQLVLELEGGYSNWK